jgi:fermentation-respiration switch protein FrsA (DUF1100 family)
MKVSRRRIGKFLLKRWLLIGILVFAIGIVMTPHKLEQLFVYYPTRQIRANPGLVGLDYQDIYLITDDQVKIHGWFIPCEGASRIFLIFHGNGGNIGDRVPWIEMLHTLGVHILIIDYRGYGRSEGKPFEEGLYRDARAAHAWWERERKSRGEKLILFGESLGGAVAAHLGASVSPSGLILQSTFTSARDMAKTMFPLGLLLPLANVHFDSARAIAGVTCPKLIIHGTRDEIVPFRLGKELFELSPAPKAFYAVPGAGHNDLPWIAGAEYLRQLKEFLSRIV